MNIGNLRFGQKTAISAKLNIMILVSVLIRSIYCLFLAGLMIQHSWSEVSESVCVKTKKTDPLNELIHT